MRDSSELRLMKASLDPGFSLVSLSIRPSVFKYLRDCSLIFSKTLHEVWGQKSKRSDTTAILKILIWGLSAKIWGIWKYSPKLLIESF